VSAVASRLERLRGSTSRWMTSWLPRAVGAMALLWAVSQQPRVGHFPFAGANWLYLGLWVVLSGLLLMNRGVRVAGVVVAVLAFHRVFWPDPAVTGSPQTLLGWFGLILAVTHGRPDERSLLIRVCVTCVYGFTALSKTNPSFLAGDQIVNIVDTRDHMEMFRPVAESAWGVVLAWGTVMAEGWMAIGLWFRRTRVATVVFGVVLHIMLTAVAARGWSGIAFLTVLNGLLVVGYLAFFDRGEVGEDELRAATSR
jgi:hypothetical protein